MYRGNWWAILNVREGGLAFHGGLILTIIVGFYFVLRYKISLAKLSDAAALPLALGYAIGRWGCFLTAAVGEHLLRCLGSVQQVCRGA